MLIADRKIGRDASPFIIAEMSGNHNQSLQRALEIVDAAAAAGAHALKLQTYTADTMTLELSGGGFDIDDENSLWAGRNLHDLYEQAHTPWDWHRPIMDRAAKHGMLCFSSPFDETAVDFLLSLDVPAFKIASFENVHLPLIRKVAATGKPMIMSTGMASLAELDDAVGAARGAGCKDLILLKCTSTYPATPENTNVLTVPHMRELFGCEIGLSDHTMGLGAAVAAVAHGATVVEKHFTLSRADGGVDSAFSLEPEEMKALVVETERAWQSLGKVTYGPTEAETKSLAFRRSIYAARDIAKDEALTPENVRIVRPGYGLAPKYFDELVGRRATRHIPAGTPLEWNLVLSGAET
jgi:N-acetylneuraminate synthase|tara:strand:+ start:9049 stop:10107 length:1059 start_codon:yes stop_codon:yes gene_type:complete